MPHTKLLLLPMLALLAALTACGGSGSSGFDISPSLENAVIQEVLASGDCGESGALTICASSAPAAIPGSPAPTPGGHDIQLDVPQSEAVPCAVSPTDQSCVFTLSFVSTGLPANAIYRIAVRPAGTDGAWIVGAQAALAGNSFVAPIDLPPGVEEVQIAVLVFSDGADAAPGPVELLADTGASFAFVSGTLSVLPGR